MADSLPKTDPYIEKREVSAEKILYFCHVIRRPEKPKSIPGRPEMPKIRASADKGERGTARKGGIKCGIYSLQGGLGEL